MRFTRFVLVLAAGSLAACSPAQLTTRAVALPPAPVVPAARIALLPPVPVMASTAVSLLPPAPVLPAPTFGPFARTEVAAPAR